jgi:hypothetical protein
VLRRSAIYASTPGAPAWRWSACSRRPAQVLALAQAGKIDAALVTELSRWGRSTQDLVKTLDHLYG